MAFCSHPATKTTEVCPALALAVPLQLITSAIRLDLAAHSTGRLPGPGGSHPATLACMDYCQFCLCCYNYTGLPHENLMELLLGAVVVAAVCGTLFGISLGVQLKK